MSQALRFNNIPASQPVHLFHNCSNSFNSKEKNKKFKIDLRLVDRPKSVT